MLVYNQKYHFKIQNEGRAYWQVPLIKALRRQSQVQVVSDFEAGLVYMVSSRAV